MKHAFFSLLLPFRPLACRRTCPSFAGYASSRALLLPCSPHVPILLRDDIFSHSLLHPKLPSYLSHKKGTAALRPTAPFRHFHPFLAALCPGKNAPFPLPGAAAAFPDSSLPPHPAIRLELAFSAPLLRQYAPAKRLYPLVLRHTLPPFGGSMPALPPFFPRRAWFFPPLAAQR